MEEREYASREDVEDTRAIGYGVNPAVWIVLALAVVFACCRGGPASAQKHT